ncbi:MAG: phosphate ABC transporter permease subunit PstC [Solirubrobacteraceae bacterium]
MSVAASHGHTAARRIRRPSRPSPSGRAHARSRALDRLGDTLLHALCGLAALLGVAIVVAIAVEVLSGAAPAMSHFGLSFLVHSEWAPNFERLGASVLIYGTLVSSAFALLLAVPLGVAIALYLATVASGSVRRVIGPLVEMLAAIPSVILGFWGILVLAPFLQEHLEPFLHQALGFLPIFGLTPTTGTGLFNASLLLTIMVIPIVASIGRDLFISVPHELRDGAIALGATRWEVVRGVILPSTASGVVAASFLGLGRALGEAIAVAQVVGGGKAISASLFATGATIASRIAQEVTGAQNRLTESSLFYCGAILLVIGLVANVAARLIVRRFNAKMATAR